MFTCDICGKNADGKFNMTLQVNDETNSLSCPLHLCKVHMLMYAMLTEQNNSVLQAKPEEQLELLKQFVKKQK